MFTKPNAFQRWIEESEVRQTLAFIFYLNIVIWPSLLIAASEINFVCYLFPLSFLLVTGFSKLVKIDLLCLLDNSTYEYYAEYVFHHYWMSLNILTGHFSEQDRLLSTIIFGFLDPQGNRHNLPAEACLIELCDSSHHCKVRPVLEKYRYIKTLIESIEKKGRNKDQSISDDRS